MKLRAIKRFLFLSREEKRIFFEAIRALLIMRWRLRRQGMEPLVQQITDLSAPGSCDPVIARRLARALSRAKRLLLNRPTCLEQALAGGLMLKRRAQPFVIHIGMQRDTASGKVGGHAWLQSGDIVLSGGAQSHQQFTAITEFRTP